MVIKKEQENYVIRCTYEESSDIIVKFQNKKLFLSNIIDEYIDEMKSKQRIEILPGVYIKIAAKLNFYLSLIRHESSHFFSELIRYTILKIIPVKIFVEVYNKKDKINICSNEKKEMQKDYYYEHDYKNYYDRISPKLLPYPDTLGGGGGRCVIWSIFQDIGLLEVGCESAYEFYSLSQLLDMTSTNSKLLDKCKESRNCGYIIRKMLNDEYKGTWENNNKNDDITVQLEEGKYSLCEGKHRVCMAKRFGINNIPVEVTEVFKKKKMYYNSNIFGCNADINRYTCHEIMEDFYSTLNRIGINKEDSHKLLIGDFIDIVEFIEEKSGDNIIEIADKCYSENMKKVQEVFNNFKNIK